MRRLVAQTIAMSLTMLTVLATMANPGVEAQTHSSKTATVQETSHKAKSPFATMNPLNLEPQMFQTTKDVSENHSLAANKRDLELLQQHTTVGFTTRPIPPAPKVVFASTYANVTGKSNVRASDLDKVLGGVLKGHADAYIRYGNEYGIDPAFLASITMQETGNGTSYAVRVQNNVGGMMGEHGLLTFSSVDESIACLAKLIRSKYVDDGLVTPEQIQKRYAPVGVSNDPTNLNQYWLSNVVSYWLTAQNA